MVRAWIEECALQVQDLRLSIQYGLRPGFRLQRGSEDQHAPITLRSPPSSRI